MVRYGLLVFTLLWSLFSAVAVGSEPPIKIGLLAPLTGAWETDGQTVANAVQLAVDEINASGGVLGRTIAFLVEDSESDLAAGLDAAHRLIDEPIVAALATYGTAVTDPVAKALDGAGILSIAWGASAVYLTEDFGLKRFFRTNARDDVQGVYFVNFVAQQLEASRIALLHDGSAYAKGLAEAARLAASRVPQLQVVHVEEIQPGPRATVDPWDDASLAPLREALERVKAAEPEALFYAGYSPEAAQLARLAKETGLEARFIGGDASINEDFLDRVAPEISEGLIIIQQVLPKDLAHAEAIPFLEAYRDRYGSLPRTPWAFHAADALRVIVKAIEATGSTDSDMLASHLRTMEPIAGITGPISFDQAGDRANGYELFRAYVVRGGELVLYSGDSGK